MGRTARGQVSSDHIPSVGRRFKISVWLRGFFRSSISVATIKRAHCPGYDGEGRLTHALGTVGSSEARNGS